jgi:peptidoglycan/xylan/chitin deacetylase (PgdA/CDA1 family)
MVSARLFIRNDDAWTLDREFCYFFESAIERGIPVVHAVIPGKMDQKFIRFLRRAKEKTPQLLDIVQHGWIHVNYSDEAGIKYEFGALRSVRSQREDINQGLKAMRKAFGGCFTPAFVPPYHGYDERTLRVLHQGSFEIFSAGTRRMEKTKGSINLPVQFSFSRYDQGKTGIYSAKELVADIAKGIYKRPLSGLVTHHADFKTAANRRELTRFFDLIAGMVEKKEWQVLLFSYFRRK